eukprot:scaffold28393_cov39-Prasinocladus_malaysianus.AAC.1
MEKRGMKRFLDDGDESTMSGLSMQENEKLQGVLSGRVGLDALGFNNTSTSKITLANSMDMLHTLPESVRGCLMEAARLCAPPSIKKQKPPPQQQAASNLHSPLD